MKFNLGLVWAALPRLGFALGLGLLVGGADLGGCAHVPKPGEDQVALSLGDWCKEVNGKLCNSVAQSCFKGMSGFADGCLESAMPSCLANRAKNSPSGRTRGELSACVSAIQPLSCKELGQGLGSGKLASICGATAPGGTAPTPPDKDAPKPAPEQPKAAPATPAS